MKSIRSTIALIAIVLFVTASLTPTAYSVGTVNKVTICHRGHTIDVPEPLVNSYLALGDTQGACVVTECQNR